MEKIKKADHEEKLRNLEKRLKEEEKKKLKKEKEIKDKKKLEINKKPHEEDIITTKDEVYTNQAIFNLVEKTAKEYLKTEEYKKVNDNNTHI